MKAKLVKESLNEREIPRFPGRSEPGRLPHEIAASILSYVKPEDPEYFEDEDLYKVVEWLSVNWTAITGLPAESLFTDPEDDEQPPWPPAVIEALDMLDISDYEIIRAVDEFAGRDTSGHY
jgi:hypothetical protein